MSKARVAFVFIVGTSAEVIKTAEPIRLLLEAGEFVEIWTTNQQGSDVRKTLLEFELPTPTIELSKRTANLIHTYQLPRWCIQILFAGIPLRRRFKKSPMQLVVQGDTMTTLLGALLSRWLKKSLVHIEAGLRSGSWKDPFPEELNRRIVSKISSIDFAPSDVEKDVLRDKLNVYVTQGNTGIDALRRVTPRALGLPWPRYILVSLHRQEFIRDSQLVADTVAVLREVSTTIPILMVTDSQSGPRVIALLSSDRQPAEKILMLEKRPYSEFISLLLGCEGVITDSGGLQEECAALNIPCLVHRKRSERSDGLDGGGVSLSMGQVSEIRRFAMSARSRTPERLPNQTSPSQIVAQTLVQLAKHVDE